MPTTANGVPVKYIGREDPFYDRLYGSNLPFVPGQVRVVTDLDLVAKLLRHDDCFERAVIEPVVPAPAQPPAAPTGEVAQDKGEPTQELEDDTESRLAAAKKLDDDQKLAEQNRLDLVQTLDSMDKDALQEFGVNKFNQKVPKNLSVENMRARIVELLDQFGAP